MLWDPGSVSKDLEDEHDNVPVTPILVPLQNKSPTIEKGVPVLVPDVQDLKEQFQKQQNMLTQIKETLKQNESQLSSKGKQVEVYANKLSQIRARSKNTQGKKSGVVEIPSSSPKILPKKSSKENLSKTESSEVEKKSVSSPKTGRRVKVSELRKCLEENKIKFEERAGKEQTETKKIESLVEQLKAQVEERDKTIQDLQKNIEQPTPKPDSFPKKTKQKSEKESVASKTTQTNRTLSSDESTEIIALQNKIYELEANVLDLEENLKEKESVIEARTQAVTLLTHDLSLKGKNTLESLEETRQEMRTMQTNFINIESQLKKELQDRENRLANLEEKCKKLESINFDLSLKNAEQQEKLVNLQTKYVEVESERKSLKESMSQGHVNDKIEELTKKINSLTKELDDRNKAMIKMKIEHKNKIKTLNKTLETLKGSSDEKAEIVRLTNIIGEFENVKIGLENRVAELEDEKGNLLLSVLDVDDFKATEKKLKDQINELEITIQRQSEDLALHQTTISALEKEKSDLIESNNDHSSLIQNLNAKIQNMISDEDSKLMELTRRIENMEVEYNKKMEELKAEHGKEIEILESYYNSKVESLDRKELEEYRISTEISNIHVEEQIELLIREKQQLLEKLKSLSGVSSMDSLTFEKMEHSDLRDDKEPIPRLGEEVDMNVDQEGDNRLSHLQRIVNDQQQMINELQKTVDEEKQKALTYSEKISELEGTIKHLGDVNITLKEKVELSEAMDSGKSQKSNANVKNRIKKIEIELSQSKKTIQEQSEKLKDLNAKLEEKEELIKNYTDKIELFEKDDWDRQNHWKNSGDDLESFQELQKKCLSLENSLLELNEDCERLRKENIEVVHLLSEEKVKRRKLLEELQIKPECRDAETQKEKIEIESTDFEQKIIDLSEVIKLLEARIANLEVTSPEVPAENTETDMERKQFEVAELQEKLEWTTVVLTSKETDIFRLQNLLEDRAKTIENLEGALNEHKLILSEREKTLGEIVEELKAKELQLEEISANFNKLQACVDVANQKTAKNESQLKELLATVKEMEGDVFKKETELQEIKGILAEKNLDMTNLRNRLEEVNSDLTYSYQEHLENMGKCLRDKESDYDALLAEKNHLEDVNRNLLSEKEDIYIQKMEMVNEKEKLQQLLSEKEKIISDLNEKLSSPGKADDGEKNRKQDMEDLKIKMKKLAANLKKKAQNEADLLKQVKDLEEVILGKDKEIEKLQSEGKEVVEKWTTEKKEKEQIQSDFQKAVTDKNLLENERIMLNEKILNVEKEFESSRMVHENQVKGMEAHINKLTQALNQFKAVEKEYKDKITALEVNLSELSQAYQKADSSVKNIQQAINEEKKAKETVLQKLAEVTGKYEEMKFKYDQLVLEKAEYEKNLEELQKYYDNSVCVNSSFDAKLQENFAVIESLEAELKQARDQMRAVEEKFFHSEERRLSLENKNDEMCKRIMENSENLVTIDDLCMRVDDLLKSEKFLQDCVKSLETRNLELKQIVDEVQIAKDSLQKDLKSQNDKLAELNDEVKQLRDSETEKNNLINNLNKELEKLKVENKQISVAYQKLNKDYEQFEIDFKENLENSQSIEKSLKHKIEELSNENAALQEKCNLLSDKKPVEEDRKDDRMEEEKKPKKKKSVTFRKDETDYIKELKKELRNYDSSLKLANEEIENLKSELFREKLRNEVCKVVEEAKEKVESLISTPEKKVSPVEEPEIEKIQRSFDTAQTKSESSPETRKFDGSIFFSEDSKHEIPKFFDHPLETKPEEAQQNNEFDSLLWDDGWGTDGHLEEEYMSTKVAELNKTPVSDINPKIEALEIEIKNLQTENERLMKEIQDQTAKYTKALKKVKELKVVNDKYQAEVNKLKNNSGFGDLDAAIVDELKSQIQTMEIKEKELLKNLETAKLEKESLLKKIDVLNAGNEKFLEMKERQDNDVEIWQRKNSELLKEISDLRQQLNEPQVVDENALVQENRELKNKVEALEWQNCELNELLEEKQELLDGRMQSSSSDVEKVIEEKSMLQKEIEELNNVKNRLEKKLFDEEKKNSETIGELNEQLTVLANENETLQDILGEMKKSEEALKKEKTKETKIFDYFKSAPADDLFQSVAQTQVVQEEEAKLKLSQKAAEVEGLKKRILEMEELLRSKEALYIETEALKKRISELEAVNINSEDLKTRISELEELLRSKEASVIETEALNKRILELEELLRSKEALNIEIEASKKRITELEDLLKLKSEELNMNQQNLAEIEGLRSKLIELEGVLKIKDEELTQIKIINLEKINEIEGLRQNLFEFQSEKENETMGLRQGVFELESLMRLKETEIQQLKQSQNSEKEAEIEILKQKIADLEGSLKDKNQQMDQFETIDLSQGSESLIKSENEMEILRQKIYELGELLRLREEELHRIQLNVSQDSNNEIESLKQKIFQLEDTLRMREEELHRIQTANWNQGNGNQQLIQKVVDLEEFIRYKENEIYQIQALKLEEENNLKQKIFELESILQNKNTESSQIPHNERVFELENLIRFKEEELNKFQIEKSNEIEGLRRRIVELETLLPLKDEEIGRLITRLDELEKSYNDSKIEIERLLNEEKLNTEEKFVEPFQKNIQIPVSFEVEALCRSLNEEKQKCDNLKYELSDKDNLLQLKEEEMKILMVKNLDLENKLKESKDEENKQKFQTDEAYHVKNQLEKIITDLQNELENSNLQLSLAKRELEEFQNLKDETVANLKSQLSELENELVQSMENKDLEISELKSELSEKTEYYKNLLEESKSEEKKAKEELKELERIKIDLEKEIGILDSELVSKENDIMSINNMLEAERSQLAQISEQLEIREEEVTDLRQTLLHLQEEIKQFRNFEKQVKELRAAQIKESGSEMPVTAEGDPDLSDWTEHELAELSTRLQSDLDTALYMLHQRDVRCDELTFEVMQLLEERDTLQLRLSNSLRINEEFKSMVKIGNVTSTHNLEESKDLVDQSNDRQTKKVREPSEDLRQLANKISELHSVSYLRDKTVKDDSVQRHTEQMNLLSRVSDSDISITRDVQSSPTVLLNWARGKTTPKVMHI